MNETLLLILALGLSCVNSLWIFLLWRGIDRNALNIQQNQSAAQRLDREVGHHRYALAVLSKAIKDIPPQEDDPVLDQAVLQNAMTFLEEFADEEAVPVLGNDDKDVSDDKLSDNDVLQFIKKAVLSNTIALSQQPIVTLPDRHTRYFEIFSRIRVGNGYIPAQKFITVAKNNNMIGALDNLLLLRCLQMLKGRAQTDQHTEFFINISAKTLGNKHYIKNLVEFLTANPKLSSRLIFEMTQQESLTLSVNTRNVIDGLALLGCRFSMDQITIFGIDNNRLLDQHISFVKFDATALEQEMSNIAGRRRIKKIKTTLDSQGINVIIEKVENEKQLFGLLELHADLGQGYLFGKPNMVQ